MMDVRIMNRMREFFKSKRNILLFSMAVTAIAQLFFHIFLNIADIQFEMIITPILSILGGPLAILGFCIVELIYSIIIHHNIYLSLLITFSFFISNFAIWKIWYSAMNKHGHEIPNLRNWHNLIKLILIFIAYTLITLILLSIMTMMVSSPYERSHLYITLDYFSIALPSGILLTIFSLTVANYFKIPAYTPKKQFKQILPKKIYGILLLAFFALGIYILYSIDVLSFLFLDISPSTTVVYNHEYLIIGLVDLILIGIYLLKPYDGDIFEIKSEIKVNLFNKIHLFLFSIVILITLIILIPLHSMDFDMEYLIMDIIDISSSYLMVMMIPILIYMYLLEKKVTNPINKLSKIVSKKITAREDYLEHKKNLNSIKVNNEIQTLIRSLLNMENSLIEYMENLVKVTSENERYETELKLGSEIQNSMIPKDFDEFCNGFDSEDKYDFELMGYMEATREVGGDFYDYFKIDEDTIGFVVGDVCGKGISAALVMVKAMTLIENYAKECDSLPNVFHEVNNLIYEDNEEMLLVSSLLGKLNLKTGELTFVNAGYNPPLIRSKQEIDDNNAEIGQNQTNDFEYMADVNDPVLSHKKDTDYEPHTIRLNKGDSIFFYADGIIETRNEANEAYGKERLKNTLNEHKDENLSLILESIEKDIGNFNNHKEHLDDITMFIIKLK